MEVVFVNVGLLYNKFHKNIAVSGSLEYKLDLHFGKIIKTNTVLCLTVLKLFIDYVSF